MTVPLITPLIAINAASVLTEASQILVGSSVSDGAAFVRESPDLLLGFIARTETRLEGADLRRAASVFRDRLLHNVPRQDIPAAVESAFSVWMEREPASLEDGQPFFDAVADAMIRGVKDATGRETGLTLDLLLRHWPVVTVREILGIPRELDETFGEVPIDLGGSDNPQAREIEDRLGGLMRRMRSQPGTRVFVLDWEGNKVPRGAMVAGHQVAWAQNGMVTDAHGEHIGIYDRTVEYGGASGKHHTLIVFTMPSHAEGPEFS